MPTPAGPWTVQLGRTEALHGTWDVDRYMPVQGRGRVRWRLSDVPWWLHLTSMRLVVEPEPLPTSQWMGERLVIGGLGLVASAFGVHGGTVAATRQLRAHRRATQEMSEQPLAWRFQDLAAAGLFEWGLTAVALQVIVAAEREPQEIRLYPRGPWQEARPTMGHLEKEIHRLAVLAAGRA